jgi:hypothetical protein
VHMFKKLKKEFSKFCDKYLSFDLSINQPALVPVRVRANRK